MDEKEQDYSLHGEEEDDDVELDDSMDEEDSELDDISETELEEMAASTRRSLFMVQMQLANQQGTEVETIEIDKRSPAERWQDWLSNLQRGKVLKIVDSDAHDMSMDKAPQQSSIFHELTNAIIVHTGLTHVILGGAFLRCFREKLSNLYEAIWTKHCHTLTYLKLGSDDHDPANLDLSSLLKAFNGRLDQMNLTEMELVCFSLDNKEVVTLLQTVLRGASKMKQLNLLGIHVSESAKVAGLMDPILETAAQIKSLDECRLSCTSSSSLTLLTTTCLAKAMESKPKWWRLGFDGLGLHDSHCQVIAQAMSNQSCKAGDLLSLTRNPAITQEGFQKLFSILFQKQRMGLVKVDDQTWQANFDLVRSMNNLHGRLTFFEGGIYASRIRWIEWLAQLSKINWEDEKHIQNYLWFTILERPDFVTGP